VFDLTTKNTKMSVDKVVIELKANQSKLHETKPVYIYSINGFVKNEHKGVTFGT
jgi:hypothetical protein